MSETISAFAYDMAKRIETEINLRTDNLKDVNTLLEASILEFRNKILLNGGLKDFSILEKYDKHFKIEKHA